jgi:hypothetical protein
LIIFSSGENKFLSLYKVNANLKPMKKIAIIPLLFIFLCTVAMAQQTPGTWSKWNFLIGNWNGVGSGRPGLGTGYFSFKFNPDSTILIRINHAEYPATTDKPATIHDDTLFTYPDTTGNPLKAHYVDNEGHKINYKIEYFDTSIILTSVEEKDTYGFRLTYSPVDDKTVKIKFEMAAPAAPDKFSTYLEGTAVKKD